jgi:hypothetical protein
MKSVWKWLAVAACGTGIVFASNRLQMVSAAGDGPSYEQPDDGGDAMQKLDRIVDKLGRIVDRMGPGGPPQGGPPHDRPHREHPRHDGPRGDRQGWGGPPDRPRPDMPPEVREMMEQRMREGRERMEHVRERMEQAREKFRELEDRVKSLESEVERLKATRAG